MDIEWMANFAIFIEYIIFLIFSISLLIKLNKMDQDLIGAKMFLKKNIMFKNFYSVGLAGGFLVFHEFMSIGIENGIISYSYDVLSEGLKTMSLVFLIICMYTWHNMLKN